MRKRDLCSPHVSGSWRLLGLAAAALAVLLAGPQVLADDARLAAVQVLRNAPERIVLDYTIGDYVLSEVEIEGRKYAAIHLRGESIMLEAGAPALPKVCRSVVIARGAKVAVNVLHAEWEELLVDIEPSKGNLLRTVDPATVPHTFGPAYQNDAFFPGRLAELSEPYILRDCQGVTVIVYPFQYNPVSGVLRVYTQLQVEVVPVGPAAARGLLAEAPERVSASFEWIYRRHFVNYEGERYPPLNEEGDMLIIAYDSWIANMQPFADHKTSIGIPATIVGVSTIGNNATSIKNYIQNVYDTSDLAFVLLVGDSAEVATPYAGGAAADPMYSLLAGGDNYPDIMVGRFSAQNAAQVDTQVLRTLEYELGEATQQVWFWRGTGIASTEGAGYGHNGNADHVHMGLIRNKLLANGYTHVDAFYGSGATAAQVTNALHNGRGIVNYCGHGSTTSWHTTGFNNSHVNALTNVGMLPFIFTVACVNGKFDGTTCFAEAWMRATHGGEPTGAVAIYASSRNQAWAPPMAAQEEFVNRLLDESYTTYGALCFAGSGYMMDYYGSNGVTEFRNWILFGDPSLRVVGVIAADALTISFPDDLPNILAPGEPTDITVRIVNQSENYVPGSGLLHYCYDGLNWHTSPLVPLGGELHRATLPAASCNNTPEYYFSAQGDGGTTVYNPRNAPADVHTALVGTLIVVFEDNFDTDKGWHVYEGADIGNWERAEPEEVTSGGVITQPGKYDIPSPTYCYVTGPLAGGSAGAYDVDGGPTILTSPALDMPTGGIISYWRWYHISTVWDDEFVIQVSNNDGATWVTVEVIDDRETWTYVEWRVEDYVTPSSQVRVRFIADDTPNNSLVEALIDDFMAVALECIDADYPLGDLNCDGMVDGFDIHPFVLALTDPDAYASQYPNCNYMLADINGDGVVDGFDIQPFVELLVGG